MPSETPRTMIPFEDSSIRRIALGNIPPLGYPFLSANGPAAALQYARDMTLQSGRILYEVWDFPKSRIIGYNIPAPIHLEAEKHGDGRAHLTDWKDTLSRNSQREHIETQRLIMDRFPSLPISCSKILAENLVRRSYRGKITHQDIEREAVGHARDWWTDYSCRVEQAMREGKWDLWEEDRVKAAVRPATRDVLERWMGSEVSVDWREKFFDRHGLTLVDSGFVRRTAESDKPRRSDVQGRQLLWHGEMGTLVGVNMGPREPGEKSVRRFL